MDNSCKVKKAAVPLRCDHRGGRKLLRREVIIATTGENRKISLEGRRGKRNLQFLQITVNIYGHQKTQAHASRHKLGYNSKIHENKLTKSLNIFDYEII